MNTLNQNPTGHSRKEDIRFSKKLFIGLGIAIVAAMLIFLMIGQRKDLSTTSPVPPATSEAAKNAPGSVPASTPTPVSEQPRN